MITPRQFGICLLAVAGTLGLSVASAAASIGSVARVQGSALINQGERYVPATEGMPVQERDRMIATEGSTAVIKFNDGCQYTLTDNQVLTVGAASTCAAGSTVASYPVTPTPAAALAGFSLFGLGAVASVAIVSAVVIGAGVAIADSNSNNDSPPRPISP